jgi:hypothetical protein
MTLGQARPSLESDRALRPDFTAALAMFNMRHVWVAPDSPGLVSVW